MRTSISSGKLVMLVLETGESTSIGSMTATGINGDFFDRLDFVFLRSFGFFDGGSSDEVDGRTALHSMSLSDPPVLFSTESSSGVGEGAEAEVLRNLYLCMVDCDPCG